MPISKIAKMKFETSAYYVPLGDTNIKFWNMDIKTAILRFQVTRNRVVLPLGKNNVQAYITLFASDGSNITDNLVIDDELNGIVSYTIPKEFLAHTGTVHGQAYISVNGTEETVTEADFTFEIKDALINKISSETKISYIRTFDDLRAEVQKRVKAIEEAIANGVDYVTAIQKARDEAIEAINTAIAAAKTDIDGKVSKATTDLNKTATDAKKAITDTATTATANVTNTSDNAVAQVLQTKKDFDDDVAKGSFLKPSDVVNYQKYPITTIDGLPYSTNSISDWRDMLTINAGRVAVNASLLSTNAPPEGLYFDVTIFRRTKTTGHIEAVDMIDNVKWINSLSGTGWSGWLKLETTAGSAQKVEDLKTLLLKIMLVAENGGSKKRFSGTTDMIEEIQSMEKGTYTYYAPAGTPNGPTTGANRGLIIKTDDTVGYVWATDTQANFYTGYQNGETAWTGWKKHGTTDTGWLNLPLKNGATALGEPYFPPTYRTLTVNGITTVTIRLYLSNLTDQGIIASIPAALAPTKVSVFTIGTSVSMTPPKVTIDAGNVYFYKGNNASWAAGAYIAGEISYTL